MIFKHIDVKPMTGALGAEIFGPNLAKPVPKAEFQEIYKAWLKYNVIFFRDQKITPNQQIVFAKKWGSIHIHPFIKPHPRYPEIIEIKKRETDTHTFGSSWHTDQMFAPRPAKATMLYAKEVPDTGGDTMFSNQYLAYRALSPSIKKVLKDVKIEASGDNQRNRSVKARKDRYSGKSSMKVKAPPKGLKTTSFHPLFRTHPETRKKVLYVGNHVVGLQDFDDREAQPIIDFLREFSARPEFLCRFRWEVGSMAIWDNRCVQHYAVPDYNGKRRRMHRITIKGDVPI
ncbi:MAG: taurine dioxygenase [Rhodospirillaceae bacterium]|nr:taurine dioxygenase [Rhodospirillaceae bacterium]